MCFQGCFEISFVWLWLWWKVDMVEGHAIHVYVCLHLLSTNLVTWRSICVVTHRPPTPSAEMTSCFVGSVWSFFCFLGLSIGSTSSFGNMLTGTRKIIFLYSVHIRQSVSALQHSVFACKVCGATFEVQYETYSFCVAPCNGLQGAVAQHAANQTRNTWAYPFYSW